MASTTFQFPFGRKIPLLLLLGLVWSCPGGGKQSGRDSGANEPDAAGPAKDADTTRDAAERDGGPDAGPGAVHVEQSDSENDGFESAQAEETGATVDSSHGLAVTGTVAVTGPDDPPDVDSYRFTVSESLTAQVHATWDPGESLLLAGSVASLDGTSISVVGQPGLSRSGELWSLPLELTPGTYVLNLEAVDRAPAAPLPYRLELLVGTSVLACPDSNAEPDYRESDEASHRNDWMTLDVASLMEARRLEDATDLPEETALEVSPVGSLVLEGISTARTSSIGIFLDGDAFLVRTGPGVGRMAVSVRWAADADVDLDVLVAPTADLEHFVGVGFGWEPGHDGLVATVGPDEVYVIWVAAKDERTVGGDTALPLTYRVTVCGW